MAREPIRVVVVAATRIFAEGVAAALALVPDGPHAFDTSALTIEALAGGPLPDKDRLYLVEVSAARSPRILVMVHDVLPAERLVICGVDTAATYLSLPRAAAVLASNADMDELLLALHSVATGGRYVSTTLHEHAALLQERRQQLFAAAHLTKREREIEQLLERGLPNREIADALQISYETTKIHVRHILQKLHVSSRHQLSRLVNEETPSLRRALASPSDS